MLLVALRPDVRLRPVPPDRVDVARSGAVPLSLRSVGDAERAALERMASGGDVEEALAELVAEGDGVEALAGWYFRLETLSRKGFLRHTLSDGAEPLLHAEVMTGSGGVTVERVRERAIVLSRFTHLRRSGDELTMESPRSRIRVLIADPEVAALLPALSAGTTPAELRASASPRVRASVDAILGVLLGAGLVTAVGDDGVPEDDRPDATRLWEAPDLAFHAHSRLGHHDRPVGGTFPFRDEIDPLPALRPPRGTRLVELTKPDAAKLEASDPTLLEAMERRRSGRPPYGRSPNLEEISALLWRTARVRAPGGDVGDATPPYEIRPRPHPSGGATYPLEWYVAHRSVDGLGAGLHHYLPDRHALEEVPTGERAMDDLFDSYRLRDVEGAPPVLVVLTARFGRVHWKYRSVAYALILKEVGVVQQSVYLVATAMGLRACALGAGDDVLFGRIAGLDPLEEAAVGEMMLGGGSAAR